MQIMHIWLNNKTFGLLLIFTFKFFLNIRYVAFTIGASRNRQLTASIYKKHRIPISE